MGQSSSRQHRQPETPRNLARNNERDDESHPADSSSPTALSCDPTIPPRAGPSRRTSVRRSILNFITPSARSRADSNTSLRKSWLSRRLSKAPSDAHTSPQPTDTLDTPVQATSAASEKEQDVSRDPDPPSADSIAGSSLHPTVSPSPDFPHNSEEVTEGVRKGPVGTDLGQSAEGMPREIDQSADVQDEVPITSEPVSDLVTAVEQSTTSDEAGSSDSPAANSEDPPNDPRPTAQHAQPPGRPFPPPGTLVVVQGVVHTTDVPRPNALSPITSEASSTSRSSSVPPNPSNDNTRNRFSTLLRSRPASASATAPDPSPSSDTPPLSRISSTSQDSTQSPNNPSADPSQSHTAPRTELPGLANVHPPPIPTSSNLQPGTISSSSIDVLGTLLSVAAAATAASLLTGTTEPMLPQSINPSYNSDSAPVRSPGPNGYAPPLPDSWPQSTSPSPINDLGPGIAADPAAAGRAERLRQAWGSIRERLGLRPTPPSVTTTSSPEMEPQVAPGLSSNDPRELVLAQMARAFNLGFGLGDSSTNPATREGGESEASQPRENAAPETLQNEGALQLSPDGSFERFLVDLQADLRAALTTSRSPSDNASTTNPSPAEARDESSRMNGQSPAPVVEGLAGDTSDPASDHADMPDLEDDDATISAVSHPGRPSTSTDQIQGASEHDLTRAPTETGRATETQAPDPRINWWRLYRFPPITARTPAGRLPSSSSSPPALSATNNASRSESNTQSEEMDATLSELPFANSDLNQDEAPDIPNTVVPVIVVGLQSVNTSWPAPPNVEDNLGDPEPLGGQDDDGREDHVAEGNPSTPATRADGSEATGRRPPSRGRAWHSRAAEALRNLRPGRRNRTAPAQTAAGSRTFLIYVIGGYYPPDHSIVTGGPDTLDSFEALLELAELLGQVKPPTVTKEDIEKSGLEIIKATQLAEYERENKISSNCIDRCLICLDDYGLEEDIRVMTCRHAFHKGCVDKWLETGRNNCPACRSRGVPLNPSEVR